MQIVKIKTSYPEVKHFWKKDIARVEYCSVRGMSKDVPIENIPLLFQSDKEHCMISKKKEFWIAPLDNIYNLVVDEDYPFFNEWFISDIPVNFPLDLDIKMPEEREDIDGIIVRIQLIVRKLLEELGHTLDLENDTYHTMVPKKYNNEVMKCQGKEDLIINKDSVHMTFRGRDFCFRDIYDARVFYRLVEKQVKFECMDDSIYKDGCLRLPYCVKRGQRRVLMPYQKVIKVDKREFFKCATSTYITTPQLQKVISFDNPQIERPIAVKVAKKHQGRCKWDQNVDLQLKNMLNRLLNGKYEYKITTNDHGHFIYYNSKYCKCCDKEHENIGKNYISIKRSIDAFIKISINCWKNKSVVLNYKIQRHNSKFRFMCKGIKFEKKATDAERLKRILFNGKCTTKKVIMDLYKYFFIENGREEFDMEVETDLKNMEPFAEVIKYEDDRVRPLPERLFESKIGNSKPVDDGGLITPITKKREEEFNEKHKPINTYFIKSGQGTAKSEQTALHILDKIEKNPELEAMVIVPLRTLNAEVKKKLGDKFTLYLDVADKRELSDAQRLIVTPDSLVHLLDHQRGFLKKFAPKMLWIDEASSLISYLSSDTLNDKRRMVIAILFYYLRNAEKVFFTDSDLTDENIEVLSKFRKMDTSVLIHNTKKTRKNKYLIISDLSKYIEILLDKLNHSKKCWLTFDTRDLARIFDQMIGKLFPKLKRRLYCRDSNNNISEFTDCNEVFAKYDLIVTSPSISYGLSFTKKHFDFIFAIFTGLSVRAQTGNQMMNRVRCVNTGVCFVHFKGVRVMDLPVTHEELLDSFSYEMKKYVNISFNSANGLTLNTDDDFTRILAYNQILINKSRNDFVKEFLKHVIRDGNKVYFPKIDYDKAREKANKEIRKQINETRIEITKMDVDKLMEAPFIGNDLFQRLLSLPDRTNEETIMISKKQIFSKLRLNAAYIQTVGEAKVRMIVEYFITNKRLDKFNNLLAYIQGFRKNSDEMIQLENYRLEKVNLVKQLLGKCGFDDIWDEKIIKIDNSGDKAKSMGITREWLKKYRNHFGDTCKIRGDINHHTVMKLLDRILTSYLNVNIMFRCQHVHKDGKHSRDYYARIEMHPIYKERVKLNIETK